MEIVPAGVNDAHDILSLQRLAYTIEAEIYGDYSIPPLLQSITEIKVDLEKYSYLIAVLKGEIIGAVRGLLKDGTCYIGRLIVHPIHQDQGYGTKLLEAIETEFKQASRYELFTGEKSEKNIYIYMKKGYRVFKTQQLSDKVRLLFLEKKNESGKGEEA
jgi:GNAT superfamily N-acetyltransferase